MAKFRITGPDGAAYVVNAPEGATQAQALDYFRRSMGGGAQPAPKSGATRAYEDAKRRTSAGGGAMAAVRAVNRGATFGFADELSAAGAMAETWLHDKALRALGTDGFTDYTPREAYDAVMRAEREADGAFTKRRPVTGTASELVGSLATGKALLKGASMAKGAITGGKAADAARKLSVMGRVREGAAAGGAAGAVYGAGVNDQDRVGGAVAGGISGMVFGGALPLAIMGGGKLAAPVVDRAAEYLSPRVRAVLPQGARQAGERVREVVTGQAGPAIAGRLRDNLAEAAATRLAKPEARAAAVIEKALRRDGRKGATVDPKRALYLQGGRNMESLADAVAQHPGAGMEIMEEAAGAGLEANLVGFRDDLERGLGGRGGYLAHLSDLKGERKAKGRELMEAAFEDNLDADVFNERFGGLVNRLPRGTWAQAGDLARMEGRNPYELGLIRADTFDGFDAAGLPAGALDPRDLAALARGSAGGRQPTRGDSLAAFLSKRGALADDGGELANMGAHEWHRGGPFRRRLVADEGGVSMDDAARAAREAGYFPESLGVDDLADNYHPVTPDDLMAALREELAGRPRYATPPGEVSRRARLDDLDARLNAAGVDASDPNAARQLAEFDDFEAMAGAHLDDFGPGMSPDELLSVETPTLRAAHYVKKALDAKLAPHRNPVSGRLDLDGNPEAAAISSLRGQWGGQMRQASPRYNEAMEQWGDDSEVLEGLELGRKALSGREGWSAEAIAMRHAELSNEAKLQFRRGVGEALVMEARSKGGLTAMRKLLRNEEVADKVRLAFPTPDDFQAFLSTTRRRVEDEARNGRILRGSQTHMRKAVEDDLADDGVLGFTADLVDAARLDGRGILNLGQKGLARLRAHSGVLKDEQANPALARMLTDPETAARVRRLLAMKQARSLSNAGRGDPRLSAASLATLAGPSE